MRREVEKLVTEQPWYQGGYRANVVAYAISKMAHDVEQLERAVNFESIWRVQKLSPVMRDVLTIISKAVHDVIVDTPAGISNVTEWAKQQACWSHVAELKIALPQELKDELATKDDQREIERSAIKDQKMLNGIEAQAIVVNAGGAFWRSVKEWGVGQKLLSSKDDGILEVAASVPKKIPSEKQSIAAVEILRRLQVEGCQLAIENT